MGGPFDFFTMSSSRSWRISPKIGNFKRQKLGSPNPNCEASKLGTSMDVTDSSVGDPWGQMGWLKLDLGRIQELLALADMNRNQTSGFFLNESLATPSANSALCCRGKLCENSWDVDVAWCCQPNFSVVTKTFLDVANPLGQCVWPGKFTENTWWDLCPFLHLGSECPTGQQKIEMVDQRLTKIK